MMSEPFHMAREGCLSWLEIDLEAVRHNHRLLCGLLRPPARMFPVVKADAYGHGAVEVARALEKEESTMMCVARVEEALELRRTGITTPLMVFTPPLPPQADAVIAANASISVCAREHIEALASASLKNGRKIRVHLKVDIGMGRLGVQPESAVEMARSIIAMPQLELEGVMSHLPCADMRSRPMTLGQIKTFKAVCESIASAGISVKYFHTANSSATMDYPEAHFDAVRCGIALYGQYPNAEVEKRLALKPAMSMKTRIVYLKNVPPGTALSYGHTHITSRVSQIATIALGYADGYPRHASNKTVMMVRGRPAAVVGRVCMDQTLLDVTGIPDVSIGDEVLAFGVSNYAVLPAETVASAIGTIGYEMTTRVGKRLPRFYI